jgi:NAD+ kinase
MLIALFPNILKERALEISSDIKKFFNQHHVTVAVEDSLASNLDAIPLSKVDFNEIDFCLSIGGDGTILQFFHNHPEIKAPVVGINLGGLGFLADIPLDKLFDRLNELIEKKYEVDKRLIINGSIEKSGLSSAINDIVIHRAQNRSIIDLSISVDGKYLNTFSADGVIIATPGGSTAYSLACGGPILSPELHAVVITPISPHTISNRPLVLMPKSEIQVTYLSPFEPVEVVFDGVDYFKLKTNDSLKITVSDNYFSLVNLQSNDYFSTLRTKLDWKGRLRHKSP